LTHYPQDKVDLALGPAKMTDMMPNKQDDANPLADIEQVGPTKPLGYLPRKTIIAVCGREIDEVKRWAELHNLRYLDLLPEECDISSGALFVWDDHSLSNLLTANAAMLYEVGWPTTTEAFVATVARRYGSDARLYELIGRAFGDFRFPFNSPVLTV
jgi:hypothetical protein